MVRNVHRNHLGGGWGGRGRLYTYRYTETWCLTSTEIIWFVRNGEKGGRGYGSGERGRLHTYRYTETWCITSTETIRLIRDGEKWGEEVWRWGKREIIYLSLH